ncbi:MAG: DsbA family protein, partial [Acidimicrobiia bacterium]
FWAFSLDQAHIEEGDTPVWERPLEEAGRGVGALLWGIAVRDSFPEQFLDFHVGLYRARFDESQPIDEEATMRAVATQVGLDADVVAAEVASGGPAKTLEAEHTEAVERFAVFGVPTILDDVEAVFVRLMERGNTEDLAQAIELVGDTRLNEFKRTRIPR